MFALLARVSSRQCLRCLLQPTVPERQLKTFIKKILKLTHNERLVDRRKHRIAYEYRHIRIVAAVLKTNISLLLSLPFLPIFYFADPTGDVIWGIGFTSVLLFFILRRCSKYFTNTIARIYVSDDDDYDKKEVVVVTIDKLGNRVDRIHRLRELSSCGDGRGWRDMGFIKVHNPDVCEYLFKDAWLR